LLSMLYAVAADKSDRDIWWIYSTQNSAHHPFQKEITRIAADLTTLHVVNIYSRPAPTEILGRDFNIHGHLNLEALRQLQVPLHADFYLCGPSAYMAAVIAALGLLGVPKDRIGYEAFGEQGTLSNNGKAPHPPADDDGKGPLVTFVHSNISFRWDPKFGSILEAAEACDVPVRWSCRTGVCHHCETALLDGEVSYSPEPLDPPAQGNILVCCSKPSSPVSLDL